MNRRDRGFHFRYWTLKTDQYTKSYPSFSQGFPFFHSICNLDRPDGMRFANILLCIPEGYAAFTREFRRRIR